MSFPRTGWAIFCHGRSFWNRVEAAREEEEEDDEEEAGEKQKKGGKEAKNEEDGGGGCLPTTSLVSHLRPHVAVRLLEHSVSWAEDLGGIGVAADADAEGAWLYSLLCRLEKPLHPDVGSALRTLAIVCSRQRERVVKEKGDLKIVNTLSLLICLVAKYFDQADMAD